MNIFLEKKITDEGLSESILKRVEILEKSKSLFLNLLSHQLRTPLNGIIGNLSLIKTNELSKEHEEIFNQIKFSSEQLQSFLESIMDYSLIISNQITIQKMPFQFERIFDNLKKYFEIKLNEKKLDLFFEINQVPNSHFLGDQKRISQILKNIIDNAIKFSELNSKIEINFKQAKKDLNFSEIVISVKDFGFGISEAEKTKLFQSFNISEAKEKGIGIGLSVALALAKLMDGDIFIESEKKLGTTVHVKLNLEEVKLAPLHEIINSNENLNLNDQLLAEKINLNILVAEDNTINQTLILNMLKKLGYKAQLAKNGRECVEIFHENPNINFIFMDLAMPELDGLEATKLILAGRENPPIIIAMTANIMDMEKDNCLKIGMNDFIQKPFKIATIIEMVEKWSKHK